MANAFSSFTINDFEQTKLKMLNWINRFNIFCFLDNHHYQSNHNSVECLAAAGVAKQIPAPATLKTLQGFIDENPGQWLFGHLCYDLKNEIEQLQSRNPDQLGFDNLFFFIPRIVLRLSVTELAIYTTDTDPATLFSEIMNTELKQVRVKRGFDIAARFSKDEYIETIEKLRRHILRGDCYEINFCQEFYAENAYINPLETYLSLAQTSPNPFSAMYRTNDQYLLCASPERYLKKEGDEVLSQPIKGTAQRDLMNRENDELNKRRLRGSEKERSENVMVVDLVRNDLSKFCQKGSVEVEELFGIYSFPQVHQMISTVRGTLNPGTPFCEMIRASFPMGSMTGAPKKKVMDLIDRYERTRRGLFSGAVGYIDPESDFDFNVVIRSILYNACTGYLSYQAGSAITYYSDAEAEYEECLLKAAAIKKVLAG